MGIPSYHVPDSRRCKPGFPDWVIVSQYGIIYAELKTGKDKCRPDQVIWLEALMRFSANVFVVRDKNVDLLLEYITNGDHFLELAAATRKELDCCSQNLLSKA